MATDPLNSTLDPTRKPATATVDRRYRQPAVIPDNIPDDVEVVESETPQPVPQPVRRPRSFAPPDPSTEPETGTTGGYIPKQAGTWDGKAITTADLSGDRATRMEQIRQETERRARLQFEKERPFAPSGEFKGPTTRAIRDASVEGEQAYGDLQQQRRQQIADRREQMRFDQKTRNATKEEQFRSTGQQFYKDEFSELQPVLEAGTNRPLFSTTPKTLTKHPKTGEPVMEMRDKYGQRQYTRPKLVASDDPMDDRLYYDVGDGESIPAMTIEEAANHPDVSVAVRGKAARKRKMVAERNAATAEMEVKAGAIAMEFNSAQAMAAALKQNINNLEAQGGSPEEIARLTDESFALEERIKSGGDLFLQNLIAQKALATEKIKTKYDAHLMTRDEMSTRLIAEGKDPAKDPVFQDNERALSIFTQGLQQAERDEARISRLMQPLTGAPVAAQEPTTALGDFGRQIARGATADGGIYAISEGLARMLERYGPGAVGRGAKWYADATQDLRETIRRALPVDQKRAESIVGGISQGVGQLGATAAFAVAGRGAPGIIAASLGQIYDEGFYDAKNSGADDATAHRTAMKYMPAAAVDALADRFVVGKLLKPLVGKITVGRLLKDILATGAVEGTTETAQQGYLNLVAKVFEGYDQGRVLTKDLLNSFVVGFAVGGGASASGSLARQAFEAGQPPPDGPPDGGAPQDQPPVLAPEGAATPSQNFPTADQTAAEQAQAELEAELAKGQGETAPAGEAAPTPISQETKLAASQIIYESSEGADEGRAQSLDDLEMSVTLLEEKLKRGKKISQNDLNIVSDGSIRHAAVLKAEFEKSPENLIAALREAIDRKIKAAPKAAPAGEAAPAEKPAAVEPQEAPPTAETAPVAEAPVEPVPVGQIQEPTPPGAPEAQSVAIPAPEAQQPVQTEETSNATTQGQQPANDQPEYPGTAQGAAVQENRPEVRQAEGEQTGGGNRVVGSEAEAGAAPAVRPEVAPTGVRTLEQVKTERAQKGLGAAVKQATPEKLEGEKINREWTAFSDESKSLGVPRAEMPQVKAEHRGALTNFLKGRGITSEEAEVLPGELKPTQAEYSQAKVDKARKFEGGDRAILVSSDGHVLDGHHQWMAKLTDSPKEKMRVIRLNAPIKDLIAHVKEFPSAEVAKGATAAAPARTLESVKEARAKQAAPATPVAVSESTLGDQPVKLELRRSKTGEMVEVEMSAKQAESRVQKHVDTLTQIRNCLEGLVA